MVNQNKLGKGLENKTFSGNKKRNDDNFRASDQQKIEEQKNKGFICIHCKTFVPINFQMGTAHRNHCHQCLWSKHVDKKISGDRQSGCQGEMEPIGLTLKYKSKDKYNQKRLGDIMLIHRCISCNTIVINRIAADDLVSSLMAVFDRSLKISEKVRRILQNQKIDLMQDDIQKKMVMIRLLGKEYEVLAG